MNQRAGGKASSVGSRESGETLIETLITIVLMSVAVVGILTGLIAVVRIVSHNNRTTNAGNTAQSYIEQLKQPVPEGPTPYDGTVYDMTYKPCALAAGQGNPAYPAFNGTRPNSNYQVRIKDIDYAESIPSQATPVTWLENRPSTCNNSPATDGGLQLITVEVTVIQGSQVIREEVPLVKRDGRCTEAAGYSSGYENIDQGPC